MSEKPKILIVDDKPENIFALESVLSELDAEVVKATNGNDALKATLNHRFALAILDVQMPGMDGYELAKLLRNNEKTMFIPIIFLSAVYSDDFHVFKGYQSGALDFLTKPHNPEILIEKTRIFLEQYQDKNKLEKLVNELNETNEKLQLEVDNRKKAEQEIKLLNESLEQRVAERTAELSKVNEELVKMQKLESVGVLAGGIAHDFNNSLQGILSNIVQANKRVNPNDEICGNLAEAEKAVLAAKNLTQQLLTFSKGGEPIKKIISITEVVRDSANLTLSGSNARCDFNIPDGILHVEADEGQMVQIFNNLFINAVQAMPGGGAITVKVENIDIDASSSMIMQEGKYVKISIEDQGAGISKENLHKIFDPYFTTKEKGSGLGLATAYSIIKKHNGHICLDSKMGVGTTFHIFLPASEKEITVGTGRIEADENEVEAPTPSNGRRILFMEDDAIIRLSVTQQLEDTEYYVETATNGTDAIDLYKRATETGNHFDVVILDLTIIGGMGGEETIEKLLEIDPNVKAIVASGYSNDPVMANYKKYGFRSVVAKPYEIEELDHALRQLTMKK